MSKLSFLFLIPTLSIHCGYSQSVIFSKKNYNSNWDLYSIDLNTGVIDRITKDSLRDFQSDYCGYQNKIVFDSFRENNTRSIFSLNLETNELILLTKLVTRKAKKNSPPLWNSDYLLTSMVDTLVTIT